MESSDAQLETSDVKMESGHAKMETSDSSLFCYNLEKDVLETFRSFCQCTAFDITLCCAADPNTNSVAYAQAHRMVLSSSSPVINDILAKKSTLQNRPCSLIYLAGITQQGLFYLLNYVYNGEVQVPKENIGSFVSAANQLKIKIVEGERSMLEQIDDPISLADSVALDEQSLRYEQMIGNLTSPMNKTSEFYNGPFHHPLLGLPDIPNVKADIQGNLAKQNVKKQKQIQMPSTPKANIGAKKVIAKPESRGINGEKLCYTVLALSWI